MFGFGWFGRVQASGGTAAGGRTMPGPQAVGGGRDQVGKITAAMQDAYTRTYRGLEASNPNMSDADKDAKAAEAADKVRKASSNLIVYDPYGRLQQGPRGTAVEQKGGDELAPAKIPTVVQYEPYVKPTRGPVPSSAYLAPHVADWQAFEQQIRCMSRSSLDALFAQLDQQLKSLSSSKNVAANTLKSNLRSKLSAINIQKQRPQPCEGGAATFAPAPEFASTPVFKPGGAGGTQVSAPGWYAPDVRAKAQEVEVSAPVSDLYSEYAAKAYEREIEKMEEQLARETSELERLSAQPQPVSAAPAYETPVPSDVTAPVMPTMSPVYGVEDDEGFLKAQGAQIAPAGLVAGGAVAASSTMEAEEGKFDPKVLLIAGAAIALLMAFGGKKK